MDKGRQLEATDEPIVVAVAHVLVGDRNVILGRDVVGQVVVHDEAEETIEEGQVHLFAERAQARLHHDRRLSIGRVPHVAQVVDALTGLVDEQWRRLRVGRLHPRREEVALVAFIPKVLIQVGVSDLFERLNVVAGQEVTVHVHKLNVALFKGALRQEEALDATQRLVRVVVGLLDQAELLALVRIEARLDAVRLFQVLQGQDEQLCIVLVVERRKGDRRKAACL